MNLESGCIFWPQINSGVERHFPRLERDISCDVAIIGGGISGALAAYHLTRRGVQVVMVDRRRVGHGSTAASTGLLQYEIDTSLTELIEKLGRERAVAAYQASIDALLAFEPLVAELGDSCGLVARRSLYLASTSKDGEKLRAECAARRSMGIDVEFIEADRLKSDFHVDRPAALWSKKAFEVDPFRLTLRLIGRAVERGLEVFDQTEIASVHADADGITLGSGSGPRVRAKKLIFATGYETMDQLPSDLCTLASTYAFASEPLKSFEPWPERCLIWESARPYVYARTTEDNRAIIGGADVRIVDAKQRDQLLPAKTRYLRDRFATLFPQIPLESACAWAGTFAQTPDGLPYIGTYSNRPHSYFALGYGGNGITFSLLAAWIIRDLFPGKPNPLAGLFRFDR